MVLRSVCILCSDCIFLSVFVRILFHFSFESKANETKTTSTFSRWKSLVGGLEHNSLYTEVLCYISIICFLVFLFSTSLKLPIFFFSCRASVHLLYSFVFVFRCIALFYTLVASNMSNVAAKQNALPCTFYNNSKTNKKKIK